jgi:hypothetical protein
MSYQIDGIVTVVEYDGDEHYRHSLKMKADRAKDEIARNQGCRVVRFPYWIQLDNLTLHHYRVRFMNQAIAVVKQEE